MVENKPLQFVREISEKVRLFWDHDFPILRLENEIKSRGGKQNDNMRPYRDMSNSYGRVEQLYKAFVAERMMPVIKSVQAIAKAGMPSSYVLPYAIAKHAPELNEYIRGKEIAQWDMKMEVAYQRWLSENPYVITQTMGRKRQELADARAEKVDELSQLDYAGILPLDPIRLRIDAEYDEWELQNTFEKAAVKKAKKKELIDLYNPLSPDDLANKIVRDFEAIVSEDLTDKLWLDIKYANIFIVKTWLKCGSISECDYKDLIQSFNTYVPLHGWREGAFKPALFPNGQAKKVHLKHSEGRKTLANDPLLDLQKSGFTAISELVANEVNNSLLKLAIQNFAGNRDLFNIKKAYYVYNVHNDEWQLSVDADGNIITPDEELFKNGEAVTRVSTHHQKLRKPSDAREHEVVIRKPTGEIVLVFTNKMLDVAQAMNRKQKNKYFSDQDIMNQINETYMKKPTSTFWICLTIMISAILICGTMLQANRYAYDKPFIIDKYTGKTTIQKRP